MTNTRSTPIRVLALRWLDANWVYAGAVGGCFYLACLPLQKANWAAWSLMLWLQLPLYIAHQLEEHVDDRFLKYVNQHFGGGYELLSPRAVTIINIGGVWCVEFLALYLAHFVEPAYALLAFYLGIVNAVVHILSAVVSRSYNPGLITAAVLLLPGGCWGAMAYSAAFRTSMSDHLECLLFVVVVHVIIVAYMVRRRNKAAYS